MLYDPRWQKADPHSLAGLIAWLELQPRDGEYDFIDAFNCVLCQYFRACGVPVYSVTPWCYTTTSGERVALPPHFNEIANGPGIVGTFGAALARARAAEAGHAL
jgi:hypothetical protein